MWSVLLLLLSSNEHLWAVHLPTLSLTLYCQPRRALLLYFILFSIAFFNTVAWIIGTISLLSLQRILYFSCVKICIHNYFLSVVKWSGSLFWKSLLLKKQDSFSQNLALKHDIKTDSCKRYYSYYKRIKLTTFLLIWSIKPWNIFIQICS